MSWKHVSGKFVWTSTESGLTCNLSRENPLDGVFQWDSKAGQLPVGCLFAVHGFNVGLTTDAQWMQRDDDLSLTLPYTAERPTGVECYWRLAEESSGRCQLETWVSASTRLLDEQIHCCCKSSFDVTQVQLLHIDANGSIENSRELLNGQHTFAVGEASGENQLDQEIAFLCSLADSDYQLLLAGYPGDQSEVRLNYREGKLILEQQLNFGFLEKGVIRRARLLAVLLPPVPAIAVEVDRCLQSFYHSPLPLTV